MSATKKHVASATKKLNNTAVKAADSEIDTKALGEEIKRGVENPPKIELENIDRVLNLVSGATLENDFFGDAFDCYVRIHHVEQLENKFQVLAKVLNYIKKNHPDLYMHAFK